MLNEEHLITRISELLLVISHSPFPPMFHIGGSIAEP
jgi:hypothetical protein